MLKKIRILRCTAFFVLAALLMVGLTQMLQPNKEEPGVYSWKSYRTLQKDTVDVMFLGSSHAYSAFDCAVLYETYGISAFNMCASGQQMWNSYYTLKEALKTQTPDVIVLEGGLSTVSQEYDDGSGAALNQIGFPFSVNRFRNINASFPEEERINYYLPWMAYHGRYSEISQADFMPYLHDMEATDAALGSRRLWETMPSEQQVYENTGEAEPMYPKVEQYYRACIELAQKKNIPIEIIVVPYQFAQQDMAKLNGAAAVAAEYGVPFTNMNEQYGEIGLDFASDFADWAHLNVSGAEKVSTAVGATLQQKYALPDHRGDGKYVVWAENAVYYDLLRLNDLLKKAKSMSEFCQIATMARANYTIVVNIPQDVSLGGDRASELTWLGVSEPKPGMVSVTRDGNELYQSEGICRFAFEAADTNWLLEGQAGEVSVRSATDTLLPVQEDGCVSFFVWDELSHQQILTVSFDAKNDFTAVEPDTDED